jgi:hypothetical protein
MATNPPQLANTNRAKPSANPNQNQLAERWGRCELVCKGAGEGAAATVELESIDHAQHAYGVSLHIHTVVL